MVGRLIPNFARDADRSFQKRRRLNLAVNLMNRDLQSTTMRKIRSLVELLIHNDGGSVGTGTVQELLVRPQPAESARANLAQQPHALQDAVFTYSLIIDFIFMTFGQAIDAKSGTSLWARGRQRLCHNVQLFLKYGAHVSFYCSSDMTVLYHYIKIINLNLQFETGLVVIEAIWLRHHGPPEAEVACGESLVIIHVKLRQR